MNLAQYATKYGVTPAAFQRKLEEDYGVALSHETVRLWLLGRLQPAPKHIPTVEAATGGKVTRHHQRPDIYGPAPKKRKAA